MKNDDKREDSADDNLADIKTECAGDWRAAGSLPPIGDNAPPPDLADDILWGIKEEIAPFLRIPERKARYLISSKAVRAYRKGDRTIFAFKSELLEDMKAAEAA
jgi:hypothetical protein